MIPTTSLQTSIKLKEVGFEQNTWLYWNIVFNKPELCTTNWYGTDGCTESYSAPTTDEILAKMPPGIDTGRHNAYFELNHYGDPRKYRVQYRCLAKDKYGDRISNLDKPFEAITNESLVEALAQCYIWLVENGYISNEVGK